MLFLYFMKSIILAAGYGTRLVKEMPELAMTPKPLVHLNGKPIIDHIIDKIEKIYEIDEINVITNNLFYPAFEIWLINNKKDCKISLVNDMTNCNEERRGAIGDIEYLLKEKSINDDMLIVGGDNLFNMSLEDFVNFAKTKGSICIPLYDVKSFEKAKLYGIAKLDEENRIIDFIEKPSNPESTLASTCIYFFPKESIHLLLRYTEEGNSNDRFGDFIQWLHKKEKIYGYVFEHEWVDIGCKTEYERASKIFWRKT